MLLSLFPLLHDGPHSGGARNERIPSLLRTKTTQMKSRDYFSNPIINHDKFLQYICINDNLLYCFLELGEMLRVEKYE